MPIPKPTQISGAQFLADRQSALLADQPRVGKTGAAILAADYELAQTILVVTTASGRAVWRRAFMEWPSIRRSVAVITDKAERPRTDVVIVGWGAITDGGFRSWLVHSRPWDLVIADESHYAKNFEAGRTRAFYGIPEDDGVLLHPRSAIVSKAARVWCLSGTPIPNAPNDLYPMMRALCPERLAANGTWPDVTTYSAFLKRYCITKPKKISRWRSIQVVIGGQNLDELQARLAGFFLLRTQQDVGITAPIYELFPLMVSAKARKAAEAGVDTAAVLAAAEAGETKALEMHLGSLRRVTGDLKVPAVVEAAEEAFACGLDKLVLMAWHKDVISGLVDGLSQFGVVKIDGSSSANERDTAERQFRDDPATRVFVGQIQAAGEAIDLSAAAELWFVEASFTPKDMAQASFRITNHTQTRQALVRVCVLEGTIDEALQAVLLRKWTTIRKVLS